MKENHFVLIILGTNILSPVSRPLVVRDHERSGQYIFSVVLIDVGTCQKCPYIRKPERLDRLPVPEHHVFSQKYGRESEDNSIACWTLLQCKASSFNIRRNWEDEDTKSRNIPACCWAPFNRRLQRILDHSCGGKRLQFGRRDVSSFWNRRRQVARTHAAREATDYW